MGRGRTWLSYRGMVLAVTITLLLAPPAKAQAPSLATCRAIKDSLQRLVCYDGIPLTGGAVAPVAPAPQRLVPEQPRVPSRSITQQRCQATTQKGTQCKRMAQPGRSYCYQHP